MKLFAHSPLRVHSLRGWLPHAGAIVALWACIGSVISLAGVDPDAPTDPPVATPADSEAPEAPRRRANDGSPLRGVQKTGTHTWQVKQRIVTRWKNDPYDLANVESFGDGWRLRRARRGDAHHLGMKNKDVILSVNGRKLKTQAQLLAAYLALKNKTEFEVVFLRNGKQLTHHYRIVD